MPTRHETESSYLERSGSHSLRRSLADEDNLGGAREARSTLGTPASGRRPNSASFLSATTGKPVGVALSKGTNFLRVRAFLTARFGPNAWKELVATFSADEQDTLASIVTVGWYSQELDARLLLKADQIFGHGDTQLATELGRFAAEMDLNGIQRMFLRLANPVIVLEKSRDYWSRFNTTGIWTVERLSPLAAIGTLRGCGTPSLCKCALVSAYIVRMFELVGAERMTFEHTACRCRGEAACVFEGAWK